MFSIQQKNFKYVSTHQNKLATAAEFVTLIM